MAKNKRGRPWFNGKDIVEVKKKLEEAYSHALPFTEVLLYCAISESSLLRYLKANEGFRRRLLALKQSQNITARRIIAEALKNNDLQTARWWLEHKDDEFKRTPSTKKVTASVTKNEEGEVDKFIIEVVDTDEKLKNWKDEQNNNNTSLSEGI